ncbi:MAG: hypothetical protein ACRD1N_04900 [Terriglobia bacterium]
MQAVTFPGSPNHKIISTRTEARRSDGASVLVTTILGLAGLNAGATARKITFMNGRVITLIDSISAKTTWPRQNAEAVTRVKQFLLNPPENCIFRSNERLLRYEVVLGQKAAVVSQQPLPDGTDTHSIKWRALALSCATLKYELVEPGSNGSERVLSEETAISLKVGEPSAALFDDGANYTEMSQSGLVYAEANHLGISTAGLGAWAQRADSIYTGVPAPTP